MDINNYIVKAFKESNIKQKDVIKDLGIPQSYASALMNGKRSIGKEMAEKLSSLYGFDKLALLTSEISTVPVIEAKPIRLADPEGLEATGDRFYRLPDDTIIMQTPVIPYKAYASYLRGHSDPEFYEGLETLPVPVDKNHKGAYLIWEIGGESMVNITSFEMARKSIWPGQKVIGRELRREHWKYKLHINTTDCWIIVHRERGIVLKEITEHNIDTGEILLHSWNPDKKEHPDYAVFLDEVDQIFNVVDPYGKIR